MLLFACGVALGYYLSIISNVVKSRDEYLEALRQAAPHLSPEAQALVAVLAIIAVPFLELYKFCSGGNKK